MVACMLRPRRLAWLTLLFGLFLAVPPVLHAGGAGQPPWRSRTGIAATHTLKMGGATLQVDFARGPLDLSRKVILDHIRTAARAVIAYYGRFPVRRARILVVPMEGGRREPIQGTTWGDVDGVQGFTRIRIARHATEEDLKQDWVMTHELVHMGFPSLRRNHHWLEEGLATYVEPLARVMTGELKARKVWNDMVRGMPQGEPRPGDEGLDRTHTWGRTYWGGALFCLEADVEIRRETGNRKGLVDALRAIVAQGGTIDHPWPVKKALAVGDRATGTHVLTKLYEKWSDTAVPVDLPKLWRELGVESEGRTVRFNSSAPMATVRQAIAGDARPATASGG